MISERRMKIGLLGFDFCCPNKGCEALCYSFIEIIRQIASNNVSVEFYSFSGSQMEGIRNYWPTMKIQGMTIHLKRPGSILQYMRELKTCDVVFDVTYGDAFSDIYGKRWNFITNFLKQLVLWSGTSLILLPQTYGPFQNRALRKWSVHLVRKVRAAYARDRDSAIWMNQLSGRTIVSAIDMAFLLPYHSVDLQGSAGKGKTTVGLNVSSLLYDSIFAEKNHFGLTVDYRHYINELIQALLRKPSVEVHLIAHVVDSQHPESPENDYRVIQSLHQRYPETFLAPAFRTPMEAKSYISGLDVFCGARMHATIAALSTGVATIPFSYSKKFEGLFESLAYPYLIHGRSMETKEALQKTLYFVENRSALQIAAQQSAEKAADILRKFMEDLKDKLLACGKR